MVDMMYQTHFTFRYVIGLNISVVASGLFISGYLLGHVVEIAFARVTWHTCRSLGIATYFNSTPVDNYTVLASDDIEQQEKTRCDEAVSLAFHDISVDLLINIVSLPLHTFATAFSWTFSGLYRPSTQ
uniref:Uncharacterized protein n=1 Tax=Caenorhabditis japonica TaxID=281687 RepID=A0A8R1IHU8_CAEJA